MATGPEMLIQTLVRALKLEPEVDKIRQTIDGGIIDKFNDALEKVSKFDERLERIERALGISAPGEVKSGSGPVLLRGEARFDFDNPSQLANGTDCR